MTYIYIKFIEYAIADNLRGETLRNKVAKICK